MKNNLLTSDFENSVSNDKKDDLSNTETIISYRGFTSIDQEMEREIAMQWYKPNGKSKFFYDTILLKNRF